MRADDCLRAGRVEEALQALQEEVRSRPAEVRPRVSLFQVFSVLGQWERARTQLKIVAELDPKALMLARVYEPLLSAELLRTEIAAGKTAPLIFGEPEPWMAGLLHGNSLAAKGEYAAAQKVLQEALDAAPATAGSVNGKACEWIADADLRFGPLLEAMIEGRYFWVPFFRIRQLRIQTPSQIHDLLWIPAGFQWSNGGEALGFIFARYPGIDGVTDNELRLSRKTDWQEKAPGFSFGSGQRILATESEDYAVLDVRVIDLAQASREQKVGT